MSERTSYTPGTPSWVDLAAADLDAAKSFYGTLFGWTYDESGPEYGNYNTARLNGKAVAGLAPMMGEGMPTLWTTYIDTDNADELAGKIEDAGGSLMVKPMEVGVQGTMMVAIDPTGAAFGAWQAGVHFGAELVNEPGTLCWNELTTRDGARADSFYTTVFGYEVEQMRVDDPDFDYATYKIDGETVAGRITMTPDFPADMPPHWTVYFAVDSAESAATTVASSGGTVLRGPFPSPYGVIATCLDPWGAAFSIIEVAPE
jgi:predicted enzyme related to lactoylglutathione lyase